MIVVTATIRTIVVYTSPVRTPEDNPTPATINPTSPLEIIPIPTLIPAALFFKNNIAGSPHPNNLVAIAIAITTALNINTSKFTVLKSTCAPIIAKNKGAKINPILLMKFSIFSNTFVAERAIPTANAPTIGDNPNIPAIAAAPKNDAVAIPSTLPDAFQILGVITFGITKMAVINIAAKNPNTLRIVNAISTNQYFLMLLHLQLQMMLQQIVLQLLECHLLQLLQ